MPAAKKVLVAGIVGAAALAAVGYLGGKVDAPPPRNASVDSVATLGWSVSPNTDGDVLRVSFALAENPERDLRVDVPLADVPAARKVTAFADKALAPQNVTFVNRAVRGARDGAPGMLHAGNGIERPTSWNVDKDLPFYVREFVREVDRRAEAAAVAKSKESKETR